MKTLYSQPAETQTQRCSATLRRRFSDVFIGKIIRQDDQPCWLKAAFVHDDKLRLDICSLGSFDRAHTVLYRTLKRDCSDCDYAGELGWGIRCHQIGVTLTLLHGELALRIFLRPRHLHRATRTGNARLEVVKLTLQSSGADAKE